VAALAGHDAGVAQELRSFFCLPFAHAENHLATPGN